ncbi:MAG: hypothetical protein L0332_15835 [Chloroflexi bacterium]|nr:hypothetical protein [Chloroflexota bacterium]MCI0578675.1 hypothetical protein [Chloroflexota bacterium]MCI0643279.1 hypothetical protein [Chloroflexota bacterium]MCI0728172.1 hypothetical protein [Chloroflexota bacterium]
MSSRKDSTLAALLEEKARRGRPRRAVSRQNVYIALTGEQKAQMQQLARELPKGLNRADIPDLAVMLLATRMELLRRAVSDRDREIPEGITDLDSLYLLWDLSLPPRGPVQKWTSIRLSPQRAIELGRAHGVLNALFGATRSDVFGLSLALLCGFIDNDLSGKRYNSLEDVEKWITNIYL